MPEPEPSEALIDATAIAGRLAVRLDAECLEYAFGGAIALGYWAEPRGTVDVDLTLYLQETDPFDRLDVLERIGCALSRIDAAVSIREHGFCRVQFEGARLDTFFPTLPFYELARERRRQVKLNGHTVYVWGPEVLCVFKMMFFRRKDIADVEQILRVQGPGLDRDWVRAQVVDIYGARDPRVSQWDELCTEIKPA